MASLIGISLWITLAMVIPGLITIGILYCAILFTYPELLDKINIAELNDWVITGIGIGIMVLTQAFGILFEEIMIKFKWYGAKIYDSVIPKGIDPLKEDKCTFNKYEEYKGLYLLIAELDEEDDSQGHLKRILSQFFLTNNTIISFLSGIILAIVLLILNPEPVKVSFYYFITMMVLFTIVSYFVAVIRFRVMAKALWAVRRKKMAG